MDIKESFSLAEEVRCDHLVTTATKKLWAVEMDLAEQLRIICKKHDIRYFAIGGTLLGAVRHKGFIPWDNDMDFIMLKEDYEKFCKVAPKELKSPYTFQQTMSLSRIRNSNTTACTKRELENAVPPYDFGIFIDIFPVNCVTRNTVKKKIHLFQIGIMRNIRRGEHIVEKSKYQHHYSWKTNLNIRVLLYRCYKIFSKKPVVEKYMEVVSKFDKKKLKDAGVTAFLPYVERYVWERKWFNAPIVELPFENTTVPCSQEYDKILRKSFGDYTVFVKDGAQHDTEIFDPDTPFMEKIEEIRNM